MRRTLPFAFLLAPSLFAQIVNPADKQGGPGQYPQGQAAQGQPVTVEGRSVSPLHEEDRVGSYQQPEWTTHRRFGETRVYVRPENTFGFEYWFKPEIPARGGPAEITTQYEFEVGLPYRFQVDWYLVTSETGSPQDNNKSMVFSEQKFEVRYAFADWDAIWGNPTVYLEWTAKDQAPDAVEGKLLLGGELCPSWHWGTNFVLEHETGGKYGNSWEFTGGLSKTLVDGKFSAGLEFKLACEDEKGDRGLHDAQLGIGPSIQYRPVPKAHIDVAPLIGVTQDAPDLLLFVVFGWDF